MRFFSEEDNKNLYKSNLPDTLKNYIANFNEIIICFLKEKFSDKENFEEILKKIKENFKNMHYTINKQTNSNAVFNLQTQTFEINDTTLEIYSIEQGLIAIYFHEFSHFISHILNSKIGSRMDEGIADLFSDELVDYFNKTFEKQETINYKKSVYEIPGLITRNACLINNESKELLWNYYTSKEKTKKFFEQAYGKEGADLIFQIEEYTGNTQYIAKNEIDYIKNALEKIDVLNSKKLYNRLNPILQAIIYKNAKEKGLSLEELKTNYPNISNDFYKKYEIMFTDINNKKEEVFNSDEINQNQIDSFKESLLEYIDINKYQNPNKKYGIYNNSIKDISLELLKYKKIINFNQFIITPTLYAYKKIYNNEEYNEEEFSQLLIEQGGFDLKEKEFKKIIDISKEKYKIFKDMTKEECFLYFKNTLKNIIEEQINISYFEKKLKTNEINIEYFVKKMSELYKKANYNYEPIEYINSLIKNFVKSKNIKLSLDNFEKIKKEIENIISNLNISYIPDINAQILYAWNIDNLSIYDITEIISKYGIDSTVNKNMFEDIRVKGLIEITNEKDITKIIRYINNVTSDNYLRSKVFHFNNKVIKNINEEIFKKIKKDSQENDEYVNNKIMNNDIGLIKFYQNKWIDTLDEEEIKIMENISNKNGNENFSSYVSSVFDENIYEKLKKYPYLALTYLAKYYPKYSDSIIGIIKLLKDSKNIKNDFLKEENKKLFIECVKDFNNNYKLTEKDLKSADTYEIELLNEIPTQILDKKIETVLSQKLINLLNEKINKIFIENHKTYIDKITLKKIIERKIEEYLENSKSDEIKQKLLEIYNRIKNINIKENIDSETQRYNELNEQIGHIIR